MPKVFKTPDDSPDHVEIVGVGVAGSFGRGGVPVSKAAELVAELQTGTGIPLTGKDLDEAAEAFAEERGLQVVNVSEKKLAGLAQEWGVPPEPIPAGQAAEEEYDRVFGGPGVAEPETAGEAPAAGGESEGGSKSSQKAED